MTSTGGRAQASGALLFRRFGSLRRGRRRGGCGRCVAADTSRHRQAASSGRRSCAWPP